MAHRDTRATLPGQALNDLTDTAQLIAQYAHDHPGRRIDCRIILDLPEAPLDYDQPQPA